MDDLSNTEITEEEFITKLNEQLISIGAASAEQSFGLAVWLGTLPILAVVAILLALKIINIILAFFLVIIFFLIFVAATSILAMQARQNAVQRAIREKILPQIRRYQASHATTLESFDSKAREILPIEAPLLQALSMIKKPSESEHQHEE